MRAVRMFACCDCRLLVLVFGLVDVEVEFEVARPEEGRMCGCEGSAVGRGAVCDMLIAECVVRLWRDQCMNLRLGYRILCTFVRWRGTRRSHTREIAIAI